MAKRKRKSGSRQILAAVLAGLWIMALLTGCAVQQGKGKDAATPASPEITGVKVETGQGGDRVIITTRPDNISYSVYLWKEPVRVVVDFSGAGVGSLPPTIAVDDELIRQVEIKALQPGEEGASAPKARVIIAVKDKNMEYESTREGNQLVVTVSKSTPEATNADMVPPSNVVLVESGNSLAVVGPAVESPSAPTAPAPAAAPAAPAAVGGGPISKNLLAIEIQKQSKQAQVRILTDGRIGDYSSFTLKSPDRLVVDLWGLKNKSQTAWKEINQEGILRVRVGEYPDKVRLVFDSVDKLPYFRFDKGPSSLTVTFSATQDVSGGPEISVGMVSQVPAAPAGNADWPLMEVPAAETPDPAPAGSNAAAEDPAVARSDAASSPPDWGPPPPPPPAGAVYPPGEQGPTKTYGLVYINAVKFDCTTTHSIITIQADRPIRHDQWRRDHNQGQDNRFIDSIFIANARVAPDLEKTFDTSEFTQSPINWFSIFQQRDRPNEVALVIVLKYDVGFDWQLTRSNQLILKFSNIPVDISGRYGPAVGVTPAAGRGAAAALQYSGELVDLDFYNADILEVLRVIAEAAGVNIVVDSDVKGRVTIRLQGVPWDQALDIILQIQGLQKLEQETRTGKVIRVARPAQLQRERRNSYEEREEYKRYAELDIRVIPINYLQAQELVSVVQPLLTPRGRARADRRTNALVVQDVPEVLDDIYRLVKNLDQPTQQVLIEARIVEATEGVTREIGVQWGTNMNMGPATGNPTGLNFPNSIQVGGAVLGGAANAPNIAGTNSAGGGAIGMTVGSLTNTISIDVLLRALEAQEKIKIISSPRILVLTDETAVIQQGVSIPLPPPSIITGTSQGWQFIDAVLILSVRPHVASHVTDPEKMIILDVVVANREPQQIPGSQAPGYTRKEASTTIMLKDGETAVIGGIFKITKSEPVTQVPFLAQIPFIGWLFQDRIYKTRNEEMIIFLTPQIVAPGGQTGAVAGAR